MKKKKMKKNGLLEKEEERSSRHATIFVKLFVVVVMNKELTKRYFFRLLVLIFKTIYIKVDFREILQKEFCNNSNAFNSNKKTFFCAGHYFAYSRVPQCINGPNPF